MSSLLRRRSPEEFRALRELFGWSQSEAANQLGVSLRQIQYIEAGSRPHGEPGDLTRIPRTIAITMLAHKFARDVREVENQPDE